MYRTPVRLLLRNSRSTQSLPAVEHWRCKMADFGEVMRSIQTEQLSLAYLSNYVECAGRRRAISPPIAYMPKLTRCTHEGSEAVSRAWSRVVLAYAMRVVLCALKAIPAMQMQAITSNRRLDCTEAGNRATSSRTKSRTHKSLGSPVRATSAILISATPFYSSSHMAVLHGLHRSHWQQRSVLF